MKKIDRSQLHYNGGSSFNLNVNSGFRLDKGHGWDIRSNHSSDVSFSAGFGFETPIIKMDLGGKRGESYSSSESEGFRMGRGSSLSYGSGAYLVVQHSIFRISIADYDKCYIIKPQVALMRQLMNLPLSEAFPEEARKAKKKGFWAYLFNRDEKSEEEEKLIKDLIPEGRHLDLIDSGLRVCESPKKAPPLEVTENYYYVTQHFTSGDMPGK